MPFETKTIPVGQLMLDTKNPRHGELESQRAAVESLIASQRQKLIVLAKVLADAGIGLCFAHPLAQGLVVDPEVAGYVGDGAAGVEDHPGTAIEQLIGVFLLSWHGLGVPFFQVGILVSGSPSNPAWLNVRGSAGTETTQLGSGGLFIFIGADAETAWLPPEIALDPRGFVLTGADVRAAKRWSLDRDPYLLATSVPGIFACGDVRLGPVKRVAAAVGEGSMAIAFVHQYLRAASSQLDS